MVVLASRTVRFFKVVFTVSSEDPAGSEAVMLPAVDGPTRKEEVDEKRIISAPNINENILKLISRVDLIEKKKPMKLNEKW